MKRYFDIAKDRLALEVVVDPAASNCPVEDIEAMLGFGGLREVDKQEFNKLKAQYTGIDTDIEESGNEQFSF